MMQHPKAFEFGEDFLLATSEAVESCQFGTFLCNNLKASNPNTHATGGPPS